MGELMAGVLWMGFGLSIVAAVVSVRLSMRGRREQALSLLFLAVLGTLAFAYVGGFSVGRFTGLIPVLFIGYMVGMGRGRMVVVGCLVIAVIVYILISWLLTPLVAVGGPLAVVFGAWGIPTYLVVAVAACFWTVGRPPRGGDAMVR